MGGTGPASEDSLLNLITAVQNGGGLTEGETGTVGTMMLGDDGTQSVFIQTDVSGNLKTLRTNPDWANVLDETHLSAVVATGAGTAINTLAYEKLTVCVVATSVTSGGTFTFQASPAGTNWATVRSVGSAGTSAATQAITANGTYIFEIAATPIKLFRANLTARTDGTYTVYVWGR